MAYWIQGWLIHLSLQQAFIDIRLRPGNWSPTLSAANPCMHCAHYVTSSIKPEVHNVAQRRQRRTEPLPQGSCIQNFVKIGPAVPKICSQTDTHTQTDKFITILRTPPRRSNNVCTNYHNGLVNNGFMVQAHLCCLQTLQWTVNTDKHRINCICLCFSVWAQASQARRAARVIAFI